MTTVPFGHRGAPMTSRRTVCGRPATAAVRTLLVGLLTIMGTAGSAHGRQEPLDLKRLLAAKSLRCSIDRGSHANWKTGSPVLEPSRFGKDAPNDIQFDAIDVRAGRARIIGNASAGDVQLLATASGLTFVETTALGSVNITTVFDSKLKSGPDEFITVMSRHIGGMMGPPLPSQYHGTCRIWQ